MDKDFLWFIPTIIAFIYSLIEDEVYAGWFVITAGAFCMMFGINSILN